jgi:hypothetical protein
MEIIRSAPVKDLSHNTKEFKVALKDFLYFHSFYTLDEYFNYRKNSFYYAVLRLRLSAVICICILGYELDRVAMPVDEYLHVL